jgi:hypothetical protein
VIPLQRHHCELNPLERCWEYVKSKYRHTSRLVKHQHRFTLTLCTKTKLYVRCNDQPTPTAVLTQVDMLIYGILFP